MKPLPLILALASMASLPLSASAAETYDIDPVHTSVLARVKHLNVSNTWGRFSDVKGTFTLNEADAAQSSVVIEVAAASVDTGNKKRDEHLTGPDFFNATQFPVISFKSTSVKKIDDTTFEVTGNFSCHGVTQPLTTQVKVIGKGKGMKGEERFGADATFELKRSDFGIIYGPGVVGEEVLLMVSVEGIKK